MLEDYAKNEKFVQDPNHYAKKVRAVADELNRVAGLIDGSIEGTHCINTIKLKHAIGFM